MGTKGRGRIEKYPLFSRIEDKKNDSQKKQSYSLKLRRENI